jgi:glycosyltransferase involved in cell wall biosynthesis
MAPPTPRVVLIHNPYSETGGGGEFQSALRSVLREVAPQATIQEIRAPSGGRHVSDYVRQGLLARRARHLVGDCDLLIVQGYLNLGSWVLTHEARRFGVPYILIPHGDHVPAWDWRGGYGSAIRKRMAVALYSRGVAERASAVVVGSGLEGERLASVAPRVRPRLRVIPNAIESHVEADGDADTGSTSEAPFVLWLGRVGPEKQLDFLISCWQEVHGRVPGAELVLAGSYENERLTRRLRAQVSALRLDGVVRWVGYVGGPEKRRLLRAARCLVLPSRSESFGRVVVEALAVGTPVVVSTGTPWHELPERAGWCIPLEPGRWVGALVALLESPQKVRVPPEDVARLLVSCSPAAVLASWQHVVREVMAGSQLASRPHAAAARGA